MMTAAQLAQALRKADIRTGEVTEPDPFTDGMIVLSDTVHITVGVDGFCLVLLTERNTFRHFRTRTRVSALLDDIARFAPQQKMRV